MIVRSLLVTLAFAYLCTSCAADPSIDTASTKLETQHEAECNIIKSPDICQKINCTWHGPEETGACSLHKVLPQSPTESFCNTIHHVGLCETSLCNWVTKPGQVADISWGTALCTLRTDLSEYTQESQCATITANKRACEARSCSWIAIDDDSHAVKDGEVCVKDSSQAIPSEGNICKHIGCNLDAI